MRRVEITALLSPKIKLALKALLDLDSETIDSAWRACRERERGYFVHRLKQAPTGKVREIHTPQPAVYQVQQKILKRVLYSLPVSRAAFGGVPKRSHLDAARVHLQQAGEILQTDVVNAFAETSYARISKCLRKQIKPMLWAFSLNREERKVVVGWLTHLMVINPERGRFPRLPLGTPTSLAVFNIVWTDLDSDILHLCHKLSPDSPVRYTRYVDDLSFSHDQQIHEELLPRLTRALTDYGYELNTSKTRRAPRDEAIIHGLCWNDGQLDLPDASILHLAQRAHRLRALLFGAPTTREWSEAAQLLRELDYLTHEVYGGGLIPNGLMIPDELRALIKSHQHRPARWADELWG